VPLQSLASIVRFNLPPNDLTTNTHLLSLFVVTFAAAFIASLLLTIPVRKLALKLNVVDHPDGHRKLHRRPIPLGGGVVILLSLGVAVATLFFFSPDQRAALAEDPWFLLGGVLSAVTICVIGLLDDRFSLRGRQKLVGQIAAVSLWLASGLWIDSISVLGMQVSLGLLAVPFTAFWLLGAINSLNLLDGVDGLATSVGIILSLTIGAVAILADHYTEAYLSLAMAGALGGFLVFNRHPASIFLGDSGSMLVGIVLGGLAIRCSVKGPTTVALVIPLAIWAIPILDSGMAILRRKLTGQSIYATDRRHLHHLVERRGWHTVMFIAILCTFTSLGAIASVYLQNESLAVATVGLVFAALVLTGVFGRHEVSLLRHRGKHFMRTLVPMTPRPQSNVSEYQTELSDSDEWQDLWQMLTEFAQRFDLNRVQLNVTMPVSQQEYHASWQRKETPDPSLLWRSEIPLRVGESTVGRLAISGQHGGDSAVGWMSDLITGLQPFESQLIELLETGPDKSPSGSEEFKLEVSHSVKRPSNSSAV
jgi:UDP-GlcNAc:undecaprenyl-phosphate GlcNAc-1-phosphate transferase